MIERGDHMLILTKAVLATMIGFILSAGLGLVFVPLMRKWKIKQQISKHVGERHLKKSGTPTFGGLIFIFATLITMLLLYISGRVEYSSNLIIVLIVFGGHAIIGFVDDYLKVKYANNKGLSRSTKLIFQTLIAIIFFYIYIRSGADPILDVTALNIHWDLGPFFGLFILFMIVGTSNAVNLTDGLDGLAGGLSGIAFVTYGLIVWSSPWLAGYEDIAYFAFTLAGSLLGFLLYNTHPAKIFMGDTGSLTLGATLAAIAILSGRELLLVIVGGVFVIETLSTFIQIVAIRGFNRRVFKMAPLHHHFEKLGWEETDIVKLFWTVGLLLTMAAITYGVWI